MQTECRVAANPQTKPKDWLLPSADTIAMYYYYSARKLILILLSHMHDATRTLQKGMQTNPMAAYHSGFVANTH